MEGKTYTATGELVSTKMNQHRNVYKQGVFKAPGIYLDLSVPTIGGRPVHQSHVDHDQVVSFPKVSNLQERMFNCNQPYWHEQCL